MRVCVIPGFIKDSKAYTDTSTEFARAWDFKFATLKWFTPVPGLGPELCDHIPPFRFGAIRNEIFVRSIAFYDAALVKSKPVKSKPVSPLQFSFKYSQSHPGRSAESLQGRASFVSLAWPNTLLSSVTTSGKNGTW